MQSDVVGELPDTHSKEGEKRYLNDRKRLKELILTIDARIDLRDFCDEEFQEIMELLS